jgi:hypothetical protein
VRRRRVLQTTLVAGPLLRSAALIGTTGRLPGLGSGAATKPSASSSVRVTVRLGAASRTLTIGKFGAYRRLKFRLPATRVAPEVFGSAPLPWRRRRAKSASQSCTAIQAW